MNRLAGLLHRLPEAVDMGDPDRFRRHRQQAVLDVAADGGAVEADHPVVVGPRSGKFIFEAAAGMGNEDPGAFEVEHFAVADAEPEPAGAVELDPVIDRHMGAAVKIRHRRGEGEKEIVIKIHSGIPFQQKRRATLLKI